MYGQLVILISGGIIVLTSFCLFRYLSQLVLLDAKSRGIQRPQLWSLLAAGGQNGGGLLLYLFKRRRTVSLLQQGQQHQFLALKRKIYCFMLVDMTAFLIFVAVVFKGS